MSQELRETISVADNVQKCYGNEITSLECEVYQVLHITWKANINATCPFPGDDLYYFSNTAAHELDTGLIDSNDVLGLSAHRRDRISYRKVYICASIHIETLITTEKQTIDGGEYQDLTYQIFVGPTFNQNHTHAWDWRSFFVGDENYQLA